MITLLHQMLPSMSLCILQFLNSEINLSSPNNLMVYRNELLRAIELRLTALKGELAAAIDQAAGTTCSFEDVINIEKFSYYFGAVEMR